MNIPIRFEDLIVVAVAVVVDETVVAVVAVAVADLVAAVIIVIAVKNFVVSEI